MQMLYNSDHYAVVHIELPSAVPEMNSIPGLTRAGYEIVDKFARREVYIEGAMAEQFKVGVEALIESSPTIEEIDAYLERYASMAQQPVVLH